MALSNGEKKPGRKEVARMNEMIKDLKDKGLKQTRHRLAILELLKNSDQPLTAEGVFAALREKKIAINLSTVYRNLDLLGEKEMLNKLTLAGESRAVFEYNQKIHRHYLICLACNKVEIIEHCPLQGYEEGLAQETAYQIIGHKLDVYGYCPACLKKMR